MTGRKVILAPNKNKGGHPGPWSADAKFNREMRLRMLRWARIYSPDTLRLLK